MAARPPGAGDTPWSPPIRDTVTEFTALLRAFVEHLSLDRFAIIAHDSGGGFARMAAPDFGSRLTALLLQPKHSPKPNGECRNARQRTSFSSWEPSGDSAPSSSTRNKNGTGFGSSVFFDLGWTARLPEAPARIRAPSTS